MQLLLFLLPILEPIRRAGWRFCSYATPKCAILTGLSLLFGLFLVVNTSPDYQQGDTIRIMFIHVPAAWMALFGFAMLAMASFFSLTRKHLLAELCARAIAPIGACFTFIALVTGSLWGKPIWGAFWVWDARLTSTLILFFLYLGYMAIWKAIENPAIAAKIAAIFAMAGAINIPVVKFSVDWWHTLHQPSSTLRADGPALHISFLIPLLVMAFAFFCYFLTVFLLRLRAELLLRKIQILERQYGQNTKEMPSGTGK